MGYFGRHWRGECSLPVAFWVNNGLLLLPFGLGLGLLAAWAQVWGEGLQGAAAAMLVLAAGTAYFGIWGPVGAWRSALRYRDEGGSGLWAGLAQLGMALSLLSTLVVLAVDVLPELPNQWRLARGHDPLGQMQLQLSADGRSLQISGPITMGASRQLAQALRQAPQLRRVLLDSPGGRLFEADAMASQLRERGLNTRATATCASACTLVFLAGTQRAVAPQAQLGFHRASVDSANPLHDSLANRKLAELYEAAALPPDFVRRVLRTPAWGMWFPSTTELVQAGVLPAPSFASGLDPQWPLDAPLASYQELLGDNPLWRALEQLQPGTLDQAAQQLRQWRQAGADVVQADQAAQALAMGALPQVLRAAQPPAQEQFLGLVAQALLAQAQAAPATGPRQASDQACTALLAQVRQPAVAAAAAPAVAPAAVASAPPPPATWVAWMQRSLLDSSPPEALRPLSALETEVLARELGPQGPAQLLALGAVSGPGGRGLTTSLRGGGPVCQAAAGLLQQVSALRGPQRRLALRQWLQPLP